MTFYHFRGHILNIKSVYENLKIMLRGHISEKTKFRFRTCEQKNSFFPSVSYLFPIFADGFGEPSPSCRSVMLVL